MTDTTEKTVTDLIAAGEALYTAITGGTVSEKAAANINDVSAIVSLAVSVADRSVTAVDIGGIVDGTTSVVDGLQKVIVSSKKKTTTTATTAS